MDAATQLETAGRRVRVVSMPSTKCFDAGCFLSSVGIADRSVVPIAVEAAHQVSGSKYVGPGRPRHWHEQLRESAPAGQLFEEFGFTVENVVSQAQELLEGAED